MKRRFFTRFLPLLMAVTLIVPTAQAASENVQLVTTAASAVGFTDTVISSTNPLNVTMPSGSPGSLNVAQIAGTTTATAGVNGLLAVGGAAAAGAAISGNPLLVGGSDGTLARAVLTDTSGRQVVVGGAASAAAVAGNPLLMAGSNGTNAYTLSTDTSGRLSANLYAGGTALPTAAALVDGTTTPTTTHVGADNFLYNGTNVDLQRGNTPSATVGITCSACTGTQTGTDQVLYNARGVRCVYDATIVTASGSFTVEIDTKDEVSAKYTSVLTGSARSTTGTDNLVVYPGAAAVANLVASLPMARIWRVKATYNSGTNQTFTIGCSTLL